MHAYISFILGWNRGLYLPGFLGSIPVHAVLQFETLMVNVAHEAWRVASDGGLCRGTSFTI